ncbi:MAG: two-component system sensor histidine kinase NtrB, partial [Methylomonas sp.]
MIQLLSHRPVFYAQLVGFSSGLLFPIAAIVFMLFFDGRDVDWANIQDLHHQHPDLFMIWTAPFVLAFFGRHIGKIGLLLREKMETLTYQTARLNSILDTAASAIITIDRAGTIQSFNNAAEQIFGYTSQETLGQNVSMLMPQEIAELHDGFLERYLQTRQATILGKRREVEAMRKSGELFPALLRVSPMLVDGELFFSGVIDDITETKTLENQLIQSQKLEAIGQLASGVAHEINTPIQFIGDNLSALGNYFSDLIAYQRSLYDKADDSFKAQLDSLAEQYDIDFIVNDSPKAIQQSLEGVSRVAEIVKAMKSFSHMESGQNKRRIDLREAINNALIISRNSYKYMATVETEFAEDIGEIECYPSELNQVFLNLIVNAAHAIEEKQAGMGLIRIAIRKLSDAVEILIQDNGTGIPVEVQDKVFNLFFTTKPVGKGTGQGLSLAHNIVVEKHQGKLFF